MSDDDVLHAVFLEHRRGNFARVGAFFGKVHVLRAQRNVAARKRFGNGGNVDGGNAHHDLALRVRHKGADGVHKGYALARRVVHLPVSCNDGDPLIHIVNSFRFFHAKL